MTRITMIIDKSGSMYEVEQEALSGFNDFLKDQKSQDPTARILVRTFSNFVHTVYSGSIMECPDLDHTNYNPAGGTALLDAIGDTLSKLLRTWPQMSQRPEMIIAILTDGEEADSRHYTKDRVKMQIAEAQRLGWKFVFLGAGIYWAYGAELGIEPKNVLDFKKENIKTAFAQMSSSVTRLRLGSDNG